ncbi:MAG: hypothetical protein Q9183_003254 [Haloplaca sp. 2 TL-2023]
MAMEHVFKQAPRWLFICGRCKKRLPPNDRLFRSISTSGLRHAEISDQDTLTPRQAQDAISEAASLQKTTDQDTLPSTASRPSSREDPTAQNVASFRGSMATTLRQQQNRSPTARAGNTAIESLFAESKRSQFTPNAIASSSLADTPLLEVHHLHVYSTKHNTHITLTKPDRHPIMSVSAGTIGFRKAARGTYDAAYQLGAYVMGRIQQQGLLTQIKNLEVVLRDFGPGREAVTKILLGSEGRNLRGRVIRVCDATRLKFGGTRSKKPRRLG